MMHCAKLISSSFSMNPFSDSDSQVADDEDELTGTDATPAGTPSTARRAMAAKGSANNKGGGSSSGSGAGGPTSTSSNLTRRQKKNRKQGGDGGRVNGDGAGGGGALAFNNNGIGGGNGKSSKKNKTGSLQLYVSLNMSDEKIYEALERYILSEEALRNYGFPVESSLNPGLAYVLSNDHSSGGLYSSYYEDADDQLENALNPNAREFHPRSQPQTPKLSKRSSPDKKEEVEQDQQQQQSSIDKVNNKSSTSLASSASTHTLSPTAEEFVPKSTRYLHQNQQQETGGDTNRCSSPATTAPTLTTSSSAAVINSMSAAGESNGNGHQKLGSDLQQDCVNASPVKKVASDSTLCRGGGNSNDIKRCLRCSRPFCVKDGVYLQPEACLYHWGKLRWVAGTKVQIYQCCGQQKKGARTAGCEQAAVHVWKGVDASDGPQYLESFVVTKMPKTNVPSSVYSPFHPFPTIAVPSAFRGVYAMDAEMAFTAFGLELVRVTVVGLDGRLVYEAYVKPDHEIIDYNTRYSGLSQREHERLASKTLKEVQNDLMGFLTAKSMLVGHGLENDLRVLRLVHSTVIDTSIVFMEESGSAMRYSLKHLAKVKLGKDIQMSEYGHDSREDAVTSMELMLQRVREDLRGDGGVTR